MYATLANLMTLCGEEELVQLTDRADPPSGLIDEETIEAALVAASNEIDGYVAAQYALPLSAAVPLLTDKACDIARYRLYKTSVTDQVRQRFEDAIKTLEKIARGMIKLPIADAAPGSSEPAGRDNVMVIQSEERIFSRSKLAGW